MSYNYLPLDKSVLTFQQVKHFLKYKQLVSITFAAHEAILKCRQYLDEKLKASDELFYGINTGLVFCKMYRLIKNSCGLYKVIYCYLMHAEWERKYRKKL